MWWKKRKRQQVPTCQLRELAGRTVMVDGVPVYVTSATISTERYPFDTIELHGIIKRP